MLKRISHYKIYIFYQSIYRLFVYFMLCLHDKFAFPQSITVDVYSDLSCPWCYVGKRRLDKAIQQYTEAGITVHWHPYIIDKNTAEMGEDYMAYNTRR